MGKKPWLFLLIYYFRSGIFYAKLKMQNVTKFTKYKIDKIKPKNI